MRTYLLLALLCFKSIVAFSQKSMMEKTSPFSAVRWEKDEPIVQFENDWYHLEKIGDHTKALLLDFCKKQYGAKWKKRFSEDLVEVLQGIGAPPDDKVRLQLSKNGGSKTFIGVFTAENRKKSVLYNRSADRPKESTESVQQVAIAEATVDLHQFEELLKYISSYSQVTRFDYKSAIKKMADSIAHDDRAINMDKFTNDISRIMSEIGDRHSSVKNESFLKNDHKKYNLQLPFGLAALNGKIVALTKNANQAGYSYYYKLHPYIKSINGVNVESLIDTYNYRDKKAPLQAKLSRGARAVQKYGALMFNNNIECPESVSVVFTDGNSEKTETVQLTTANKAYAPESLRANHANIAAIEKRNFDAIRKILPQNIGYINIPEMNGYDEVEGLESFIENSFKYFSNTRALIIDIRNNPGGSREILRTFAAHILPEKQSPWVANIAYLRTEKNIEGDEESMSARNLYSYNSDKFSDNDRRAIDRFNKGLKVQQLIDSSKFSGPFYMLLHNGQELYNKPVYILVNEASFSAASVFTSAFKGLPNVKIVGATTDGSSGNSKVLYLKHSKVRITVSTMLSYQPNGKTLDGNGTVPDIVLQEDEKQILTGCDTQLNKLIEIVNGIK